MSMQSYDGFLPKNIQKILIRMANLQRKEIEIMRTVRDPEAMTEETLQKLQDITDKGTKAILELLQTRYATATIGIGEDEEATIADILHQCADYFLGLYALERLSMESLGEEGNEDMFYAAAFLAHRSILASDEEDLYPEDEEDEYDSLLTRLAGEEEEDPRKIVPLFGDRENGKK